MNGRGILPAVVIAALLVTLPVRAQQGQDPSQPGSNPLNNNYGSPFPQTLNKSLEDPPQPSPPGPMTTTLSPYILGANSHPDGCCGPTGCNGSIGYDIYFRTGAVFSFGTTFADDLNLGWAVQGGARALLFDREEDAAWVFDIGITNIFQTMGGDVTYNLFDLEATNAFGQTVIVPVTPVTGDSYNRTLVSLSLGRELWLAGTGRHTIDGCATCDQGMNWRIGWDVGGRWGSEKFQPNEVRHRTGVDGGVYLAAHTDLEIPCGACIFQTGLRLEYGYTWSDILQRHNRTDVQDIMLLWNLGLRF